MFLFFQAVKAAQLAVETGGVMSNTVGTQHSPEICIKVCKAL
jgi:hypothetical protein